MAQDRGLRRRLRRPRHGRLLRRPRPRRRRPRRRPGEDRRASPRRGADPRARARGAARAQRRAADVHARRARGASRAREFVFVCVDTPPHLLGRRRSLARVDGARRAAGVDGGRRRHEGDRAGGHGREGARRARRARARSTSATCRTRSSPPRARRCADFLEPDRIVVGAFDARTATRSRRCTGHRRAGRAHGRHLRRDGQARGERVPDTRVSFINEIANVCELVGADVAEVAEGSGSTTGSARTSCGRGSASAGRCFPKDSFAEAARGELGLPLPAAERGHRGERAAEAARDPKLQKHLGSLRGKTIALLGLAFKPNTDDMREAPSSCSHRGCSPKARTCGVGSRSPTRARSCAARPSRRRSRRSAARTPPCRHRVGGAARPAARGGPRRDAEPVDRGRANVVDPDVVRRPGSRTRASAARRRQRSPGSGDGRAATARALGRGVALDLAERPRWARRCCSARSRSFGVLTVSHSPS